MEEYFHSTADARLIGEVAKRGAGFQAMVSRRAAHVAVAKGHWGTMRRIVPRQLPLCPYGLRESICPGSDSTRYSRLRKGRQFCLRGLSGFP